jgi:glyoxalase family protein
MRDSTSRPGAPGTETTTALSPLLGIHHITALASDAQRNVDFYVNVLGLRLVKQTVNFDAPDVYHLYYGDNIGKPGSILTFFPFPGAARGRKGTGEVGAVAFAVPGGTRDYWIHRLSQHGLPIEGPFQRFREEVISFEDPDGLSLELVIGPETAAAGAWKDSPVPAEVAIRRLHGVTIVLSQLKSTGSLLSSVLKFQSGEVEGDRTRFLIGTGNDQAKIDIVVNTHQPPARTSAGSVHHIAWRVGEDAGQEMWRVSLENAQTNVTEVLDRRYFRSIYFREPGGVLFEIATDQPGFLRDESEDSLGSSLMLPPWLEQQRTQIVRALPPIVLPKRDRADASIQSFKS